MKHFFPTEGLNDLTKNLPKEDTKAGIAILAALGGFLALLKFLESALNSSAALNQSIDSHS